jgi:hypothetical protein
VYYLTYPMGTNIHRVWVWVWVKLYTHGYEYLPALQMGLIQKQGWLILVKPVISAKHVHQCLVAEAPVWLFEESEK